MSIYMDKPPTTCECCPCNDDSFRCGATGERFDSMWYMGRLASCPIKPLADVVEVVKCKDCKKQNVHVGYKEDCCPLFEWRGVSYGHEHDFQFCSYGERGRYER